MVRLVGGGASSAPAPSFDPEDLLTIEGRVRALQQLIEHLTPFVLSDKPSAKLVEAYLRTLSMLREEADKLKMSSRGDVDDIISQLVHGGNRISDDHRSSANAFSVGEDQLV